MKQLEKLAEAKVLPLRYWDDPLLSTVCAKIEDNEFGSQLEEFGAELIATMREKHGIGLAAPQVGVAKRVFAMGFPENPEEPALVVVNPTLRLFGSNIPGEEGCLSLPDVRQQVYRAEGVEMRYFNPLGEEKTLTITRMGARVVQHEYDHLDGIMFFDTKDRRPEPWGARMSRQMSKSVLRDWDKQKKRMGI